MRSSVRARAERALIAQTHLQMRWFELGFGLMPFGARLCYVGQVSDQPESVKRSLHSNHELWCSAIRPTARFARWRRPGSDTRPGGVTPMTATQWPERLDRDGGYLNDAWALHAVLPRTW